MHSATLDAANGLRAYLGVPIKVNSGCRCVDHNKAIGGATASWHMPRIDKVLGRKFFTSFAMDLAVDNPAEAAYWLKENYPAINVIVYDSFIHIDARSYYQFK